MGRIAGISQESLCGGVAVIRFEQVFILTSRDRKGVGYVQANAIADRSLTVTARSYKIISTQPALQEKFHQLMTMRHVQVGLGGIAFTERPSDHAA